MSEKNIWLCDLTYTQQTVAADTIPMAIGCIAEYAEKRLKLTNKIPLFKYPEELIEHLERGPLPDVLGFSNYVWNMSLSYEIAMAVKAVKPEVVIVFGGPNYPITDAERFDFLSEMSQIDFYVVGEGEDTFTDLLEILLENDCSVEKAQRAKISSVHHVDADGIGFFPPKRNRIVELDEIPSPYTSGRLDKFFDGKLMPLLQTNRGCPFSCTFCVEGDSYYTKIRKYSPDRVSMDIDYIGRSMDEIRSPNSRNDLFIADSNFGMYPSDIDSCHSLKESREKYHWPEYINVATGKNSKERVIEAAELLDGALRLSGSVQSLDEKVLSNIKRKNISVDGLVELGLHSKRVGVNSYSEIILGLPGDSKQAHQDTIRKIIDAGFNIVLPWQLMLIHGSELATESNRKRYKMDVRARIFPRCYGSYRLFGKDINIAEVEEVCVANDTLPFEDYLECRRLNLFVAIFYNDTIFSGILKLLRSMDISIFDWILCLLEKSKGSKLEPLVDEFLNETNGELWSSKSDLKAFFSQKVNIKRYISGELGRNNLYFYRTLALTREIDTLRDLAREAALEVVNIAGHRDQVLTQFISELVEYHSMRIRDIFTDYEDKIIGTFRYDFAAFEKTEAEFDELRATEPQQYEFYHNEEQRDLIKRSLHVHGSDSVGIARILSRVFVKKLYREVETKKALSV